MSSSFLFSGAGPCRRPSLLVLPESGSLPHTCRIFFNGDGSPLFLRQFQMTSTPQNLIKNIIFMPQFLPGDVKMAPGDVKMAPGDVKLQHRRSRDPQILIFLHVCLAGRLLVGSIARLPCRCPLDPVPCRSASSRSLLDPVAAIAPSWPNN